MITNEYLIRIRIHPDQKLTCPSCGSDKTNVLHRHGNLAKLRCRKCQWRDEIYVALKEDQLPGEETVTQQHAN